MRAQKLMALVAGHPASRVLVAFGEESGQAITCVASTDADGGPVECFSLYEADDEGGTEEMHIGADVAVEFAEFILRHASKP